MKIFNLIFCLFILSCTVSFGQSQEYDNWCGTVQTPEMDAQLDDFVKAYYINKTFEKTANTTQYLPLTYHLVGENDGDGRISYSDALDDLCQLNTHFENSNTDITFYLANFNLINSTPIYGGSVILLPNLKNPFTINSFVMGALPGLCGRYDGGQGRDYIILNKFCMGTGATTWAHEMGHLLTLPHPFFGWEGNTYSCGSTAPNWAEKYDGSNCTTAGDRFCDTGPDYLSDRWNCNGNCQHKDANGDTGTPDGTLFMSYSSDACQGPDGFSDDQIAAMHYNISTVRSGIVSTTQSFGEITQTPVLISPINGQVTEYRDWFKFEWQAVPNATHYIVEGSIFNSFNNTVFSEIVTDTYFEYFDQMAINRDLFWRVRPYNKGYFCTGYSNVGVFEAGTLVAANEIKEASAFDVFPNPVSKGNTLFIELTADEAVQGDVQLVNLSGQLVRELRGQKMAKGNNQFQLNTAELESGIYFVKIQTEEGLLTKKVVIQ